MGGSITSQHTGTRWPEAFIASWLQAHPGLRLEVENVAIGATGSDLGVFMPNLEPRLAGCDLIFVEYSVNDQGVPADRRRRSREGLLRRLLGLGCDLVLVHTYCPEMREDMEQGQVPASVADFELLADYYDVGSVWVGLHAFRAALAGTLRWEDWLPDGLHPETHGSLAYAEPLFRFVHSAFGTTDLDGELRPPLSPPLDPRCWQSASILPLARVETTGPWSLRRWQTCQGLKQALHSTATGARLGFSFEGFGCVLGFDFGRLSGEILHRVDGGPWLRTERDRPSWCGDRGWLRPLVIELPEAGAHRVDLETCHAPLPGGHGSHTTLGLIGILH
jgi:hypothetical protein